MEIDNGGFLGLGSETDMAECTYRFTREYMLGLLNQRAVHVVDGLSKLHRRILFVLRDKGRDTVYNLAGSVMQFHPSGDSSIAEGMTRMMQPWHHHNILFEPQGGVGGYSGEDAAAPRYLETTISQFTKDIFLPPRWERTVPMITNSKMRKEPDHFIPLLPGALLMGSNVTAKGFATKAPTYNLYDVCSLVMAFTEEILSKKHRKNADNYLESFARYMIPDPTSCCRVLNYKQQLKAIKNNNFQLPPIYEGVLEMGINHLAIRSLPPGYPFSKIDKTLKKLIVEKKPGHSVLQEINDESDAKSDLIWGKYRVDFKKNVDILKYLDLMKHMVGIVQKNHFNFLWQYNGRLQRFTPPEILDIWGDERYRNIGHEYVDKIKRLIAERRRIEAMIIVRHSTKDTDDAINIIRNANTVDEANRALADRFNLTLYQTKALTSMKISTLTKANLQQLKDRKEEIIKEIAEFNYKLKHIPERMFSDAERIRKKYTNNKLVRRAVIPKYRYMVNFINKSESGFFQCEDKVKLMTFLKRFDKAKRIDVMARPPGLSHLYHFNDSGAIVPDTKHDIFKEGKGKVIVSNNPLKYTVKLENGTICAIKGLYPIGAAYVGSRVVCIYKNGIVEDISTTKLPVRKSISALGNLTDIKYIFDSPAKEYFICHMSPKELNTIRIGKIKNRKGKLKWPIGKNYILGLYKLNQEIIIKLPKECISRLGVDHVRIESLKNFFGDGDRDNFILDIKKSLKKTKFFYEG